MPVTPNLSLKAQITNFADSAYWSGNDNTNDPYIGLAYQWQVTITIQPQPHSNHTTATPNYFTGQDVKVGDWFASGQYGRANLITSIVSADFYSVTCILEDYERYNLFTDPNQSGVGLCDPGVNGIIFRLGGDGLPALGPIDDFYLPTKSVEDLLARFIAQNSTEQVLVHQAAHGMYVGDVIYADPDSDAGYKKVTSDTFNRAIGVVVETNVPGLEYFSFRPIGRLVNNVNPPLWGSNGDIFYMDPNEPGGLTNVKPDGIAIPVYMQLDLPTRAILLERGAEVEHIAESETNKYDVESVASGQTTFTMPDDAKEILYMAINGIENENFTFDVSSKVLTFDPVETGYGVDVDDEVFFIYKT